MGKKFIIPIIVVLVLSLVLFVAYIAENLSVIDKSGERITFNVSAVDSNLSSFITTVKTKQYYEGYDEEVVKWMESLNDKRVFYGNRTVVIMDASEASKIPKEFGITDVDIYEHFSAEVIEMHKIGDKYQTVYHVRNVEFIRREIVSNGLA